MTRVIGITLSAVSLLFVCLAVVSFVGFCIKRVSWTPPAGAHVSDTYTPVALAHSTLLLAIGLVFGIIAFVVWRSRSAA